MVRPVPLDSKFTDPNYHIWCGSCVKGPDGKYHLFYSRWPKNNPNGFSPGWAIWSEVAYAIADSPGGPFTHVNVALPARGINPATGQKYWDGDMSHNPYCIRKDGIYYLYYIGNFGDGTYEVHRNNDRIGVAWSNNPAGPWTRLDQPIIDITPDPAGSTAAFDSLCVANPAITVMPDGKILVIYKGVKNSGTLMGGPVRYGAAIAETPTGSYIKQASVAGEIFLPPGATNMEAEDPFIWYSARYGHRYYAVARDVVGTFTGVSGGLAQFESTDGLHWSASAQPKVLGANFTWEGGQLSSSKVERPWVLLDETGLPIRLFGATNGYQNHSVSYNVQIPLIMPPEVEILSPATAAVTVADTLTRLHLSATATSSMLPEGPAISWTRVSGPAEVVFENANAAETHVAFSQEGLYILRCTATDAAGSVSDDVTVAVDTPLTLALREGANGYSHTAAMIRGDNPTWNGGARDQMLVGRNSSKGMRAVLSFPLGDLPADGVIHSVSLDLWTAGVSATAAVGPLQLRLLDGTPTEGSGDGQSSAGATTGATWNHRTAQPPGDTWIAPGGDIFGGVLAEVPGYTDPATPTALSFASSDGFVAAARDALVRAAPFDLMLYSPQTESSSTNALTRLASDDHATNSIRPRLTVTFSGNHAPIVNPGPPPVAFIGVPAVLSGEVTHATSCQWKLVSGPGAANFTDASDATTSVTFEQAGIYLLELSATGALAETSRTLEIQVTATDPATLAGWQAQSWPGVNDPDVTGPGMDPDQDGLNNLLEWALHLDPNKPDTFIPAVNMDSSTLEYTYTRRKTAPGQAIYQVEWSDTLADPWTPAPSDPASEIDDTRESVRTVVPLGTGDRRFIRLKITQP